MNKKHLWQQYNRILSALGFHTPLLRSVFALPLCIVVLISCILLPMGIVSYFLFAIACGMLLSLYVLVSLARNVVAVIQQSSFSIWRLLFSNLKLIIVAISIVVANRLLHMPLVALLLGFTIPLYIISICQVIAYIQKNNSVEGI